MAPSPRRRTPPHRKPPRARPWTPEEDIILETVLAAGRSYNAARQELRWAGSLRSEDAIGDRARKLGLRSTSTGITEEPTDIRDGKGQDRLLAALAAAHFAPPADVRPGANDARPLMWRRLQPSSGAAGSPAALCAEGGGLS